MPASKTVQVGLLSTALIVEIVFALPFLTHHHAATLAAFTVLIAIFTFHGLTDILFPHQHDPHH